MNNTPASLRRLAVTIGDSSGIGPEITARWLARRHHAIPRNYTVDIMGNCEALRDAATRLGIELPSESVECHYSHIEANSIGETSYQAIVKAAEGCLNETYFAMTTGPISKTKLKEAGLPYSGHTEILEDLAKKDYPQSQAEMMFFYKQFRLMLLTRHIALSEVSTTLTPESVYASLSQCHQFLHQHLQSSPRIAVMGVNPHAGEIGGHEEADILTPAMTSLNTSLETQAFHGPFSADALLRGFDPSTPSYDAYVAAYHDQGLIPMKLLAGLHAVNVTIGLPFLRTSVSHGTAEDIAGLGIADETSLIAATDMAFALSQQHSVPIPEALTIPQNQTI